MSVCHYCRRTPPCLTVDHVVPVSRGGLNMPFNKVQACRTCNAGKSDGWPSCRCQWCLLAVHVHAVVADELLAYQPALGQRWLEMVQHGRGRTKFKPTAKEAAHIDRAVLIAVQLVPERFRVLQRPPIGA